MDDRAAAARTRVRGLDGRPEARGARPRAACGVALPRPGGETIGEPWPRARRSRLGDGRLRLVYGAANQLGLHLDRILTVREAEQGRFRSILDSMPQAVVVTDAALRVVQANAAAAALLAELGSTAPTRFHPGRTSTSRPLAAEVSADGLGSGERGAARLAATWSTITL